MLATTTFTGEHAYWIDGVVMPVAWKRRHGKGRVFYSSLGHTKEAWENPDVQKMYLEAVKWAMKRTEGSTAPHPKVN